MLKDELQALVKEILENKCETSTVELKAAKNGIPEKLYDTLSSFANTDGGVIVFGIDEKNDFAVCGVRDIHELQKKVSEQALQMEPVLRPIFTSCKYEGKDIVGCEIAEVSIFDKPCFYRPKGRVNGSYIRVGDGDMPMTEYEVYSYEAYKRNIQDEKRPVINASIDDLDRDALNVYFAKTSLFKPHLSKFDRNKILYLQGITDKDNIPTIAGIMLFGIYPQSFYPQLSITAVLVNGDSYDSINDNKERFIDNKRIEGTISQMLEEALAFIIRNSKKSTIIDDHGKRSDTYEYPIKALREILLNALIHRDYSVYTENTPIRIMMYNDRIEVENPGGLYGRIKINELGKEAADTRNPFIAGALEILEETENRFSGIPTIYHEMEKAGLEEPIFTTDKTKFKVTLYNKAHKVAIIDSELNNTMKMILAYCKEPRSRDEIAAYINIGTISYITVNYLRPLIAKGLLNMTIPDHPRSKHQKYYSI